MLQLAVASFFTILRKFGFWQADPMWQRTLQRADRPIPTSTGAAQQDRQLGKAVEKKTDPVYSGNFNDVSCKLPLVQSNHLLLVNLEVICPHHEQGATEPPYGMGVAHHRHKMIYVFDFGGWEWFCACLCA